MTTAKDIRIANLKRLKDEFGSITTIAKAAGTSPAYLSQILTGAPSSTGTPRGIGDALARKIEAGCGKLTGWMDRPHDDSPSMNVADLVQSDPDTYKRVVVIDDDDPRLVTIPLVRLRLTAGISGFHVEPELHDDSTSTVPAKWVHDRGFNKANLIAIQVRGESMEPTFYAGDTVILNTADKEPADGGVFAVNYEGEPVVKRMMRDAGQWWLTSDSADQRRYQRKLCEGEGCIIIGRVVRRETERF